MHSGGLAPSEYRKQIDSDLARRSSAGGFVYLGFLVALLATTDYFSRYPKTLATFGAFSAASAGLRFFLGRRFQQRYDRNPRAWRSAYFLSINLNILAWGALLAITFLLFGYDDWKTLLLLIYLAGTAPIALYSLNVARSAGPPCVPVCFDPSDDLRQSVCGRYPRLRHGHGLLLVSAFRPVPRSNPAPSVRAVHTREIRTGCRQKI